MTNINDFLRDSVRSLSRTRVAIAPSICEDMLKAAVRAFRFSGNPENVTAIYDNTLFGSGTYGLLFTGRRVIYRSAFSDPIEVAYGDIATVICEESATGAINTLSVSLKTGEGTSIKDLIDCDYSRLATLLRSCAVDFDEYTEECQIVSLEEVEDTSEAVRVNNVESVSQAKDSLVEKFRNVSPWALLGGAIIGVGAVAAAPFTGGGSVLGGATLLASLTGAVGTATVAAGIGAGTGAAISSVSSEKAKKDEAQKKQAGLFAVSRTVEKVRKLYQDADNRRIALIAVGAAMDHPHRMGQTGGRIALIAVGAAMAACDNVLHEHEERRLETFVSGMSAHAAPPAIRNYIQSLLERPPTFERAMDYLDGLDESRCLWSDIDTLLTWVCEADGIISPEEQEFLNKWASYKADRSQGGLV